MPSSLGVSLLGPLEVTTDGVSVDLGGPRQRAILARLLVAHRAVVPTDRLIDDIWAGSPPPSASGALQAYVFHLRRALEPSRSARSAARVLVTRRPGYGLQLDDDDVDAWAFERTVQRELHEMAEPPVRAGRLRAALALWQGSALAEFAGAPWADTEIARLDELRLVARERLVDALITAGSVESAVVEAQALVAESPLREEAWRLLALGLYAAGRQGDSLAALRRARAVLADELGIDPGPRLAALEQDVLNQRLPVRSEGDSAGTPRATATRPMAPVIPMQLPVPVTPLLGRELELAELCALIDSGARMVTVTGPGGIGKTRLAIEAATRASASFAGDVCFVALHSAFDAEVMWSTIGDALGVEPARGVEVAVPVLSALDGRRILLVLDNLEQIRDAPAVVRRLVERASDITVLATSRQALFAAGEQEFVLQPLTLPDDVDAASVLGSPAGRVFAHHARTSRPSFSITQDNAESVAALCRRLDGLPLALELAAAQTRFLTPARLLSRLDGRLGSGVTAGDRPHRHRSLTALIGWSYELLDPPDQALFRRLGVFRGPADLHAVASVASDADPDSDAVLDGIMRLASANLVRLTDNGDGDPAVDMLETIRAFAVERSRQAGEFESTAARHLLWCADEVAARVPLIGTDRHDEALGQVAALDDDVRAALDFGVTHAGDPSVLDAFGRLVRATTSDVWYRYGQLGEARSWQERALESPLGREDSTSADLRLALGLSMRMQGDLLGGVEQLRASVALARAAGDEWRTALALGYLALTIHETGETEECLELVNEALDIAQRLDDPYPLLTVIGDLVVIHLDAGRYDEALQASVEQVRITAVHGSPWMRAISQMQHAGALLNAVSADWAARELSSCIDEVLSYRDRFLNFTVLEYAAAIAAALEAWDVCATLTGAAQGSRERSYWRPRTAAEARRHERWINRAQRALGPDAWSAGMRAGRGLSPREAADTFLCVTAEDRSDDGVNRTLLSMRMSG